MLKTMKSLVGALCTVFIIMPHAAFAQTKYELALGTKHELNIVAGDSVTITAYPDRSYCCSIIASLASGTVTAFSSVNGSQSLLDTITSRGNHPPELALKDTTSSSNRRQCWHEASSTSPNDVVLTTGGASGTLLLLCEETTLVGGFNTSVTDFNFLEISVFNSGANLFTDTVSGVINIQRTVAGTTKEIPFSISIEPGEKVIRKDFNIHDAVNNEADFGAVTIIHDGAAAQVKAKLTQYRIVTQSPLDFEPVLQEVFVLK